MLWGGGGSRTLSLPLPRRGADAVRRREPHCGLHHLQRSAAVSVSHLRHRPAPAPSCTVRTRKRGPWISCRHRTAAHTRRRRTAAHPSRETPQIPRAPNGLWPPDRTGAMEGNSGEAQRAYFAALTTAAVHGIARPSLQPAVAAEPRLAYPRLPARRRRGARSAPEWRALAHVCAYPP